MIEQILQNLLTSALCGGISIFFDNAGRLHCCFEKKLLFCMGEYTEYGFDQQRLIWYVVRQWDMVFI